MRIRDILLEDYRSVDLEWVLKNCSEAIERYSQGHVIYRGDRRIIKLNHFLLMVPRDVPRTAAYAGSNLHTEIINSHPKFDGFPKREIIMTTDVDKADNYGGIKIALPVNGANIGIVPTGDIFMGFSRIVRSIGSFYETLVFEFMPYIRKFTDSDFKSVSSTNKVFQDIKKNASEHDIDALVYELANMRTNAPLYQYHEILINCIKQGNGEALFSLFSSEGFEYVPIKSFVAHPKREVWTDSPTVLLNPDDVDALISDGK